MTESHDLTRIIPILQLNMNFQLKDSEIAPLALSGHDII